MDGGNIKNILEIQNIYLLSHCFLNLYDFVSSAEHKSIYFEEYWSKHCRLIVPEKIHKSQLLH